MSEPTDAEGVAKAFHETHQRLSGDVTETPPETRGLPWDELPPEKRQELVSVFKDLLSSGTISIY